MDNNTQKKRHVPQFVSDIAKGFCMGVAFIIPGFSGGSIAAILGIYEKLIGAVADIFKDFKRSFLTLLPIFTGLALGAVSLLFPLGFFIEKFPLPTVSLFVGLAIGGLPSITDKLKGRVNAPAVLSLILASVAALALSFLPTGAEVNLFELSPFGYVILFGVGIIGSMALVIPGISGSMLLLILGYYNPIVRLVTDHLLRGKDFGISVAVLACCGIGIAFGFIIISKIMKLLLEKFPTLTYAAIVGFILGSIPTVYISTAKDTGITLSTLPQSPWHWIACIVLLILGLASSLFLIYQGKKLNANTVAE